MRTAVAVEASESDTENLPTIKVKPTSPPSSNGLLQPTRQLSLLSLMGYTEVQRRILSYVSCGEGGLKSVLNFRQCCSTAKTSFDRLPPAMRKKIFSRGHVKIDLEFDVFTGKLEPAEILDEFERHPPSDQVTSLKLMGVRSLSAEIFAEEEQLWIRFVLFWWPKLESLEVDFVDNLLRPMDSCLNLLLSSPNLRRLHCHTLQEDLTGKTRVELPQRIFHMEHLSVDNLELSALSTIQFFDSLARNPNLQSFKLKVKGLSEIRLITKFLEATKENANFEVTLEMECFQEPSPDSPQLDTAFVSAVAESSSTIRLLCLDGKILCKPSDLRQIVGEKKLKKFAQTVEWISEFETAAVDKRLMEFPGLKRLDLLKNPRDRIQLISFPEGLQRLGVFYGIPQNLPSTLTHLDIRNFKSSVPELMESLKSIDKSCPGLETLEMKWTGDSTVEIFWTCVCDFVDVLRDSQSSTVFRKLKSLTFTVDASYRKKGESRVPANLNGARWILLNGFQLPRLSLLKLTLGFAVILEQTAPPPVLDCNTLNRFIKGQLGKSLVEMNIGKSFVMPDAVPVESKMREKVMENAVGRRPRRIAVGFQKV